MNISDKRSPRIQKFIVPRFAFIVSFGAVYFPSRGGGQSVKINSRNNFTISGGSGVIYGEEENGIH
jgi:hypothetical protein